MERVEFSGPPGLCANLTGYLYRPAGDGPHPAVVLLHGCGGLYGGTGRPTRSYRFWGEWYARQGYAALLVDSFSPRGYSQICTLDPRPILPERERVEDAYAGLAYLKSLDRIEGRRVVLMGWSNGGSAVLHAVDRGRGASGFAAAVAFYPGCGALERRAAPYRPYAPLLVLAGEADDWTPARHCAALVEAARAAGSEASIEIFPGAHHAFDRIGLATHFRPEVRNPTHPGGRGATVGSHPEARQGAISRLQRFLRQLP